MVVAASTQFWEDLPPTSVSAGQVITVTGRITNTGDEEQDFRLSVQVAGLGAVIFPVPLETWSPPTELSPNEIYTARASFRMPNYGVQVTVQAEWYNRAGLPAQWVKVGTTQTRNIALAGVTPEFPVQAPQIQLPTGLQLQISPALIVILLGGGFLLWLMTRK